MKVTGLLLKKYSKDIGLFPKIFFKNKKVYIVDKEEDGTIEEYEIATKQTKTGFFEYDFTTNKVGGTLTIKHGFKLMPTEHVIKEKVENDPGIKFTYSIDEKYIHIKYDGESAKTKVFFEWSVTKFY